MIEVIYNGETKRPENIGHTSQGTLKNIRQIGKISGRTKIYVEDSTMGFLQSRMRKDEPPVMALLGNEVAEEETTSLFVTGAVLASKIEVHAGKLEFAADAFTDIYDEAAAYFAKSTILGWFLPAYDMIAAYADKLGETSRLFLAEDPTEQEELFYLREQKRMTKMEGYYIYYQNNVQMKEYMQQVREAEEEAEEAKRNAKQEKRTDRGGAADKQAEWDTASDRRTGWNTARDKKAGWGVADKQTDKGKMPVSELVKNNRRREGKAYEKREVFVDDYEEEQADASVFEGEQPRLTTFLYAVSTVLAIVVLVVGITMIGNYERMYEMQDTIETIAGSIVNGIAPTDGAGGTGQATGMRGEQTENASGPEQETEAAAGDEKAAAVTDNGGEAATTQAAAQNAGASTQGADGVQAQDGQQDTRTALEAAMASGVVTADASGTLYYTVQRGDTLLSISRAFYGTEEYAAQILAANLGLTQNELTIGQKIILPQ